MKKFILSLLVISNLVIATAQSSKIVSDWLLTKVEFNGEKQSPYQVFTFKADGALLAMGMEVGTWKYNKKSKNIILSSDLDKDFNGEASVIKLTDSKMVLKKDETTYYYRKINPKKIATANKQSQLAGLWKLDNEFGETQYLKFELPDKFTTVNIFDGGHSISRGTWMYKPSDNSFIIISRTECCDGKNNVIKMSKQNIKFKNEGLLLSAERISGNVEVEKLSFTSEEIEQEVEKAEDSECDMRMKLP